MLAIRRLLLEILRPAIFIVRGHLIYALLIGSAAAAGLQLTKILHNLRLPAFNSFSLILERLPDLALEAAKIAGLASFILFCLIAPLRIIFIHRKLAQKLFFKEAWNAGRRILTSGTYCLTRAVPILLMLSASNSLWFLQRMVNQREAKILFGILIALLTIYFGYRLILLFFAVIVSTLSNTGARNSIRLTLLLMPRYRFLAIFWLLSPFLFSGLLYLSIHKFNLQNLQNLLAQGIYQQVLSLTLLWYSLTQTGLKLLDGLINLEKRMPKPQREEPEPAKPVSRIKNLVVESGE